MKNEGVRIINGSHGHERKKEITSIGRKRYERKTYDTISRMKEMNDSFRIHSSKYYKGGLFIQI